LESVLLFKNHSRLGGGGQAIQIIVIIGRDTPFRLRSKSTQFRVLERLAGDSLVAGFFFNFREGNGTTFWRDGSIYSGEYRNVSMFD
jgi:hypothetical protein